MGENMRPLVIYHKDCLDGFSAAWVAWTQFGDEADYLSIQYGDPEDSLNSLVSGREVYILDFSFSQPRTMHIINLAKKVVWLDHHKSAFGAWCRGYSTGDIYRSSSPRQYILLDDNKSGVLLAWEYFYPNEPIPTIIQYLDDYDRWQFKLSNTKVVNKALWSHQPWDFHEWDYWMRATPLALDHNNRMKPEEFGRVQRAAAYNTLITEGKAILYTHKEQVKDTVKNSTVECALPMPSGLIYGLAVNCYSADKDFVNDVGNALATLSGAYGLVWRLAENRTVHCSIRSNGKVDVSAIAKVLGGGGHQNAAGFTTTLENISIWLNIK